MHGTWVCEWTYFETPRTTYETDSKTLLDSPLGKIYIGGPTISGQSMKHNLHQNGRYQFTVIPLGKDIVQKTYLNDPRNRTEIYYRDGEIEKWDDGMKHCRFNPAQQPWSQVPTWVTHATHVTCPVHYKGPDGRNNYVFRIHNKNVPDLLFRIPGGANYWPYECCNYNSPVLVQPTDTVSKELQGLWVRQDNYFDPYHTFAQRSNPTLFMNRLMGTIWPEKLSGYTKFRYWSSRKIYEFTVTPLGRLQTNIIQKHYEEKKNPDLGAPKTHPVVYFRYGMIEKWDQGMPNCTFDKTDSPWSDWAEEYLDHVTHITCPVQFKGTNGKQNFVFRIHNEPGVVDKLVNIEDGDEMTWPHECCNTRTDI